MKNLMLATILAISLMLCYVSYLDIQLERDNKIFTAQRDHERGEVDQLYQIDRDSHIRLEQKDAQLIKCQQEKESTVNGEAFAWAMRDRYEAELKKLKLEIKKLKNVSKRVRVVKCYLEKK